MHHPDPGFLLIIFMVGNVFGGNITVNVLTNSYEILMTDGRDTGEMLSHVDHACIDTLLHANMINCINACRLIKTIHHKFHVWNNLKD